MAYIGIAAMRHFKDDIATLNRLLDPIIEKGGRSDFPLDRLEAIRKIANNISATAHIVICSEKERKKHLNGNYIKTEEV